MSIMVQGKETLLSSSTQEAKSWETKPLASHLSTMVTTLLRIFSPFREQLSVLTTAMGYFPALYRSSSRAVTLPMAETHFSGPAAKSFSARGVKPPSMPVRA